MKRTKTESGISLVEVLVVIVLLLVGIFSVIRVFPPGFLINQRSDNATRAARLATQEVNRLQVASANLPDAIVPITVVNNSGTYQFKVDFGATPDDLSEVPPEAIGQFPWSHYWSDVNKVRRIIGETVRIPLPSPTAAGRGSIYMLSQGPYMAVNWDGRSDGLFIQGAALSRITGHDVNESPSTFLFSPFSYAIDYNGRQVAFYPVGYDRQFLLTFGYYNSGTGQVETIIDQAVTVPANTNTWLPFPVPGNAQIIPDSDTVGRKFVAVTAGSFSQDPYEYYVDSPTVAGLGNFGVIVFNPLGRDYTEQTNIGPRPLSARIDYDVLDWHVLKEDRSIPAAPPFRVALSLKDLKKIGDTEINQENYEGLLYGVPKASNIGDMVVYNVATGQVVPQLDPGTGVQNYSVGHKDGVVDFSDAFGNSNRSGVFRFFYRANGDWALSVQKAASRFRKRPDILFSSWDEFYLGTGSAGQGQATRIYFPLSEAGKTISIRELYYSNGTIPVKLANASFQINSNRALFENIDGVTLTWVDIRTDHPDAVSWDYSSTGQAVAGVQGISMKVRVVWGLGGNVPFDAGGNAVSRRWQKIDKDTILTRTVAQ